MYLRRINIKKCGKDHYYWALVESYRTEKGVRQRIVGYIGRVNKSKAESIEQSINKCDSYQQDFFSEEELPLALEIESRKTRTERLREFGGVWIGLRLFKQLGLEDFFKNELTEEQKSLIETIKILIISRFYHPSSELQIVEHLYSDSAMEDLIGIPSEKLYNNLLYRGLDKLLGYKNKLEVHLKERIGTLFNIKYDIFLYDVTSTYVEGEHVDSKLCQRGYSRDNRPDCKQVCIALVVTREGLPLGYEIFSGNTHDSKTVEEIVNKMESQYGTADRIWVMDRGMISDKNLEILRNKGRKYIIGTSKKNLKQFEIQLLQKSDWEVVRAGVEVKFCQSPENQDEIFILCRSKDRALKEQGMHDRFIKRIGTGLEKIKKYCKQKVGQDITKIIERRVGRLLQQNSRGAGFFKITTSYDKKKKMTILLVKKNDGDNQWLRLSEGHYLLRSNIKDWQPQELWEAYINLTDAEEAFKIHKSDLKIRPLWHQKDERIKAHIFVCFLAFVMWKTFGLMCKRAGLGDEPRRIFNEIKKIKLADVVLTTTEGNEIKIRTVVRPDKPLQVLLQHLGYKLPERLTKHNL
jgi:transposase